MADVASIREQQIGVRSRISWSAIMGGAVVSIAVYLVMTLFGAAIGLSVNNRTTSAGVGTMAAVWAVLTTVVSLFLGGWITARSVVGETTAEAGVHALIMWGVVMAMIMWLVASGARAGFGAMIGFSQFSESSGRVASVEEMRQRADKAVATAEATNEDTDTRQVVANRAAEATWWTLLGTIASMAAAMAGGFMGGGNRNISVSSGTRTAAPQAALST